MNKKIIIIGIIIAGLAFFGGLQYGKSSAAVQPTNGTFRRIGTGRGANGGFTAGSIISNDGGSITIQMQNGSTMIALIGTSTQVMKTVPGSLADLSVGKDVVVTGSTNSDGSLTAQSVQIRQTRNQ